MVCAPITRVPGPEPSEPSSRRPSSLFYAAQKSGQRETFCKFVRSRYLAKTLNRSAFSQHKSVSYIAPFARGLLLEFELVVHPLLPHQRFSKRFPAAAAMKSNRLSLGIVSSTAFITLQGVSLPSLRLSSTDAPCILKLSARRRCFRIAFAGVVW